MKVYILLPAYNEESSILPITQKIDNSLSSANIDYQIIVCNDGSTDNTLKILKKQAKKYPIHIISHSINRGLGETSRDNFEAAALMSDNDDVIVRLDCDETHEPDLIIKLISQIEKGYDVAIASRFKKGGGQKGVSRYRAFISYGANVFMKLFFNIPEINEYSCGYRAYSAKIIKKCIKTYGNSFIQLKGFGFTCTLEKLIKIYMIGGKFTEIPFILRYDRKKGNSKMIGSITFLGYILMVILYYWPWGGWLKQKKSNFINMKKSLMRLGS